MDWWNTNVILMSELWLEGDLEWEGSKYLVIVLYIHYQFPLFGFYHSSKIYSFKQNSSLYIINQDFFNCNIFFHENFCTCLLLNTSAYTYFNPDFQ